LPRRAAFLQFGANAATSAATTFIAVVAYAYGANLIQVGAIVAAYNLSLFLSTMFSGRAADRYGRLRLVRVGFAVATATALLHAFARTPAEVGGARVLFGFSVGLYPPALTSLAYDANRRLGRFTSWGSLGMSVGTLAAGLLTMTPLLGGYTTSVFLLSSVLLAAGFAVSLTLPQAKEAKVDVPIFPKNVLRRNLPAYTALLLRHVGATAVSAIFPLFLLALGANLFQVALVSVINGVAQFVVMQFVDKVPSGRALILGLLFSTGTFLLYAVTPNLWFLGLVQLFLGASWGMLYTGALKFVMERNVERATSTGLLQSTQQLAAVIGPLLGGAAAVYLGYRLLMIGAAVLSLAAVPLFLYEIHRHPGFLEEMAPVHAHPMPRPAAPSELIPVNEDPRAL
jgi:MFS family permease